MVDQIFWSSGSGQWLFVRVVSLLRSSVQQFLQAWSAPCEVAFDPGEMTECISRNPDHTMKYKYRQRQTNTNRHTCSINMYCGNRWIGLRSNPWRLRLVPQVIRASFRKETNLGFFLILLSSMDIAPVKLFTYSLYVLTATLPEN